MLNKMYMLCAKQKTEKVMTMFPKTPSLHLFKSYNPDTE